ncbi:flavodoxin family protein [Crassaminicella profunda]|uniref:flavodoxin family protein n=1 Tax=Crassaminicella profunda TaxID=1286698 RepID=UPI001CA6F231|nr:flavodoxin family protein [Crassaminicella profunda]QZY56192.1 flavodoxin family protein [Crassaminicella profunda]
MAKIIAFSGSTVKSGVLEKAMEQVLKSTGEEWELVRLNTLNMNYCTGCVGCASTNRCVLKDDMNEILEKILEADAILLGGVARFGKLNAVTKTFIERLFPLIHRKMLTKGKIAAAVAGGFFHQETVKDEVTSIFQIFNMEEVGVLTIDGNASCFKCGYGETCDYSAFRAKYGQQAKITDDVFYVFDEDKETVERATLLGKKIAEAIKQKA